MNTVTFLTEHSSDGFLPLAAHFKAMETFACSFREIEHIALENNITPLRYKRNQKTISVQEQCQLFNATVFILGCGGLGGFVSEFLTRIGVGNLILMDGDIFEEHNLNRQNFSSIKALGSSKSAVVKSALEAINPALHVTSIPSFFELDKHVSLLENADVVVDALDNPTMKTSLARYCKTHHKAFVHAAIAGYSAQFCTSRLIDDLYMQEGDGAEKTYGNPSFTVAFAAAIQSAEVVKLLLNKPHLEVPLRADLWDYEFNLL
ncbi:MAG: ThiF family adenylyltransferase [Sulfurospirillaceae bacterium]|nr:ThiF family adenylyltransferase [Sulfurospirillaceae bacterium]MDD2826421.1 ThiF family adenylyltransferase [Sulfurospirillaceae bacterium]